MGKIGEVFGSFDIGIGAIGNALLVFFLGILILGLVIVGVSLIINNKKYKHIITITKKVGNITIKVATYKAKDFKIGNAGDKLWFVKKVKKYISPATLQSGPREYTHHEREDGEWINVCYPDVDEDMKKMGVKFVHQDMRANRIAISNILDQRFTDKGFWDKYGNMVINVIFYLVVAISMVVIFYQWSNIIDKTNILLDRIIILEDQRKSSTPASLIPALLPLIFRRKKK